MKRILVITLKCLKADIIEIKETETDVTAL
jgi:hypothetical protein